MNGARVLLRGEGNLRQSASRPPWLAAALAWSLSTVAACTVGPSHVAPAVELPGQWGEPLPDVAAASTSKWWTTFGDPRLDALVDRALAANLDLAVAEARVREARANRRVAAAPAFPVADAAASVDRSRASENVIFNVGENTLFQAGFDASWEIDVFGRTRRAVEAADAEVEATELGRADVLLTVIGEVARNYVELRGFQRQLEVATANLESQRETLDLTRAREAAGLASGFDAARATALVESTMAGIPQLEASAKQAMHRLAVLLGEAPASLAPQLEKPAPIPVATASLPPVLPSELLRRRPDLRRAERLLAASTARVGVATADLYPRFSILGSAGLGSLSADDFFRADSASWSIGPSVSWPIFRGGQIVATIEVREAQAAVALLDYRRAILGALEEVENAIVALDRERVRREALARAVAADRDAVAIADELYRRGLRDFLSVLDARRSLLATEVSLARAEAAVSANLVALHKALGGGWEGA